MRFGVAFEESFEFRDSDKGAAGNLDLGDIAVGEEPPQQRFGDPDHRGGFGDGDSEFHCVASMQASRSSAYRIRRTPVGSLRPFSHSPTI
jgi:hypothetical protein